MPQPIGEALGDLARVVADPHGGERREGDEIPDTATKLLDFVVAVFVSGIGGTR